MLKLVKPDFNHKAAVMDFRNDFWKAVSVSAAAWGLRAPKIMSAG